MPRNTSAGSSLPAKCSTKTGPTRLELATSGVTGRVRNHVYNTFNSLSATEGDGKRQKTATSATKQQLKSSSRVHLETSRINPPSSVKPTISTRLSPIETGLSLYSITRKNWLHSM